jgi:hypothetical protein
MFKPAPIDLNINRIKVSLLIPPCDFEIWLQPLRSDIKSSIFSSINISTDGVSVTVKETGDQSDRWSLDTVGCDTKG